LTVAAAADGYAQLPLCQPPVRRIELPIH
jgi:hypothetical protein